MIHGLRIFSRNVGQCLVLQERRFRYRIIVVECCVQSSSLQDGLLVSMSPVKFFAIAIGSIIVIRICFYLLATCRDPFQCAVCWLTKHLNRRNSIFETNWLGSWTWWSVLVQSILIGTNLLVTCYRSPDVQTAARRAGEVAIVNMGIFYLGLHLSFQADVLQVSLAKMKSIHRGITWSFTIVIIFHVAALKPTQPVFTSGLSNQLYGVIVCCS